MLPLDIVFWINKVFTFLMHNCSRKWERLRVVLSSQMLVSDLHMKYPIHLSNSLGWGIGPAKKEVVSQQIVVGCLVDCSQFGIIVAADVLREFDVPWVITRGIVPFA